jgi:hypothetical protein
VRSRRTGRRTAAADLNREAADVDGEVATAPRAAATIPGKVLWAAAAADADACCPPAAAPDLPRARRSSVRMRRTIETRTRRVTRRVRRRAGPSPTMEKPYGKVRRPTPRKDLRRLK